MTISPIADHEPFSMATLHEASQLARENPAQLTDLHLRHYATYDAGGAVQLQQKRDRAIEAQRRQAEAPPRRDAGRALPADVARLPTIDRTVDFSTDAGLDAWATANKLAAVPVVIWRGFVKTARERRQVLEQRVQALETRLAAFEGKPHVKFCGVWRTGVTYEPGDAATHGGGLWICKAATTGEPSKDFVGWQLAVKRGSV